MALSPSLLIRKSRLLYPRKPLPRPVHHAQFVEAIALVKQSVPDPSKRSRLVQLLIQVEKRLREAEKRSKRASWTKDLMATRMRLNVMLCQSRDETAELARLLDRHRPGQGNMYSRAHGKRVAQKLGREHYVRMGKLGAAARWHKPKPE